MQTATSKVYYYSGARNTKGESNIKIRVTFDRKHKYFKTNIFCDPDAFNRATTAKRKTEADKVLHNRIKAFADRAESVINDLPVFTFDLFEQRYLSNRDASTDVYSAFETKAADLRAENKIGTAVSYECAKKSLQEFKSNLRFADISVKFLNAYEKWMLEKGNTLTSVGIYLRALRHIWNSAKIAQELNPFGAKKYEIPTGSNKKKALTIEEVGRIFNFEAEKGSWRERAKDYWVFIYLCNGINVKDLCLLRQKNIKGDIISYQRAKTLRKKTIEQIQISLKPQAKEIIRKHGVRSIDPEAYVFPHLAKDMTPTRQREVYQQLTQTINKNMKRVASELHINKPITTYYARHSFATILKRSGASTELISEALGHSDLKTTKAYLDSFEIDTLHKLTDNLIPKVANQ